MAAQTWPELVGNLLMAVGRGTSRRDASLSSSAYMNNSLKGITWHYMAFYADISLACGSCFCTRRQEHKTANGLPCCPALRNHCPPVEIRNEPLRFGFVLGAFLSHSTLRTGRRS